MAEAESPILPGAGGEGDLPPDVGGRAISDDDRTALLLIKQFAEKGDDDALASLFDMYSDDIRKVVFGVGKAYGYDDGYIASAMDADILPEVYQYLHDRIKQGGREGSYGLEKGSFESWFKGMARGVSKHIFAKLQHQAQKNKDLRAGIIRPRMMYGRHGEKQDRYEGLSAAELDVAKKVCEILNKAIAGEKKLNYPARDPEHPDKNPYAYGAMLFKLFYGLGVKERLPAPEIARRFQELFPWKKRATISRAGVLLNLRAIYPAIRQELDAEERVIFDSLFGEYGKLLSKGSPVIKRIVPGIVQCSRVTDALSRLNEIMG